MIVFDASLAVKWFVDERHSEKAASDLRWHKGDIAVPGIFVAEVMGALVRRANMDKSLRADSEVSLSRLVQLIEDDFLRVDPVSPVQMLRAASIAIDIGHPLKDCIYLVLAMELGCPLVTADTRFAAKARDVYGDVRVLGEAA